MALIAECLDNLGMKHSLGVFLAEAQLNGVNRGDLCGRLNMNADSTSADTPLLMKVLSERNLN